MNIQDIRQKYPQYGDMSDKQLADALHAKYYSDIPKSDFYGRIGFSEQQETTAPTVGERAQAGLSGVNRGIAGLVGLPVDTAENIVNLGIAGVGTAATALGRPDLAPDPLQASPGTSAWIRQKMGDVGIGTTNPRPDDPASRMLHTGGVIAGGSMVPGATVKNTLSAAAGGALASETLGPEWTGVGAIAPSAIGGAVTAARNAVASRTAPVVETFKKVGTTPSVGQATDTVFFRGLENLASKFPGGATVIKKFVDAQQASFGAKARTGVSAEAAGRAIEKGIRGPGGFIQRSKQQWQLLDDALAAKVGPQTQFQPNNTIQALDDLTRPVQGAAKTTGALVNPKLAEMKANIQDDLQANNGVMPYEAIRALRTRVGSMLDDALVAGVPQGELKKLYGALSKDLEAAAAQAGASREFARQNQFYSARMSRIEDVLERVIGRNKQPEEIFKTLVPRDPDQAGKVRAVMRSLAPAERQVVSEAIVNRLGRAQPGKQDDLGELFSSEVFLSNWNRMSSAAKAQLFPNHAMRQNVEAIAKAASQIRSGAGIYANPSGTAGSFAAYSVYGSPIASAATGSLAPVAAAGAAMGTAYLGAKMLTSPKVVEWLARPVNPAKPAELTAHLARLAVIYNQTEEPELKAELGQFISGTGQQAPQPAQ